MTTRSTGRWLGVLLLLALGTIGLGSPAPARAQSGWSFCADENETCHVGREGLVRFGVDGRWAHKDANGDIRCDTRTFGDPAPQRRKHCEVTRDWDDPGEVHDGNWRFCAREGQDCDVGSRKRVRFGADGRYAVREFSGRIDCSTKRFGDPRPNVVKHCQVEQRGGGWGGGGGAGDGWGGGDGRWQRCANEGGSCRVPGRAQVRYGAPGRYAYRDASGSIDCSNKVFGDPAPDQPKSCDYSTRGGGGGGGGGWGGSGGSSGNGGGSGWGGSGGSGDSEWAGPDNGLVWNRCADEGGICAVRGTRLVRFGVAGRYRTKLVTGTVACKSDVFGGDPAPGRRKSCEARAN